MIDTHAGGGGDLSQADIDSLSELAAIVSGNPWIISDVLAGDTIAAGNLVRLDETSERWKLANAGVEASTKGLLGIALGAAVDGGALTVGRNFIYTTTGLVPGAAYMMSTTSGEYVPESSAPSSPGEFLRYIGYAKSATEMVFNPDTMYSEIGPQPEYSKMAGALGGETSDATTGQQWEMTTGEAFTATRLHASLSTAAVGADFQIDVKLNGTTILNAVLSITAGSKTAETSSFATTAIPKGGVITVHITQIGSSTAGAGAKFQLFGN